MATTIPTKTALVPWVAIVDTTAGASHIVSDAYALGWDLKGENAAVQISIQLDSDAPLSLQEQLAGHLRASIAAGRINPGCRLPGSRAFSDQLGVSRNTVLAVYECLAAEGYVVAREGAGTFVSDRPLAACPGPGRRMSQMAKASPA